MLADPGVAAKLAATGAAVAPGTAADFAAAIDEQRAKLAEAVKALGIRGN